MASGVARYQSSATENSLCLREDETCCRPRLDGQRFCLQHMKLNRDSIYRQCNYVSSKTGQRCFSVAVQRKIQADKQTNNSDQTRNKDASRKLDDAAHKDGFCLNHARLVTFFRRRTTHRNRFRNTPDSLLENVESILHLFENKSQNLSKPNRSAVLDYYSESSDDEAQDTVGESKAVAEDSDIEIDESDDPLKHAGVYSADEIVRLSVDKMTSLKQCYLDYLSILRRKYKIKRQRFLKAIKLESESQGSLLSSVKTYKDRKKMIRLRAMRRYGKCFGKEALLHKQMEEKKRKFMLKAQTAAKETNFKICTFKTEEQSCTKEALPLSTYCLNHILNDKRQTLFKNCASSHCQNIVYLGDDEYCLLHRPVPILSAENSKLPFKIAVEKSKSLEKEKPNRIQTAQPIVNQKLKVTKTVPKPLQKLKATKKIYDLTNDEKTSTPIQPTSSVTLKTEKESGPEQISNISSSTIGLLNNKSSVGQLTLASKPQDAPQSTPARIATAKRKSSSPMSRDIRLPKTDFRENPSANQINDFLGDDRSRSASFDQRRFNDHSFAVNPFPQFPPYLPESYSNLNPMEFSERSAVMNNNTSAPQNLPSNRTDNAPSSSNRSINSNEHSYGRF